MRVLDCHDLVVLEARYHITCIERFSRNKGQNSSNTTIVGRPVCNQTKTILIFFAIA